MKKIFLLVLSVLFIAFTAFSCGGGGGNEEVVDDFNVSGITVPSSITVTKGDPITFSILANKGPKSGDVVVLKSNSSTLETVCQIASLTSTSMSFNLPDNFVSGYYTVYIRRNDVSKQIGKTTITLTTATNITPATGSTVYGLVSCDGTGVPNVVVSDGIEVTTTDAKGVYNLKSAKKWGYVFISVPSGYEVTSDGVLPKLYATLTQTATTAERADFLLTKVNNDNFTLFVMGDMHLANRTNDRNQFFQFTDDLNDYMTAHSGTKMYGITLGDMTWDLYWYSNSYYFPQYLSDINSKIKNLQIFHTMGNHDNDMDAAGDFNTATKYVRDIAPDYYSFNLGKIHFMVLDDILCTNNGTGTRTYDCTVTQEELDWITKDLSYVPKGSTIFVTAHAPFFYPTGTTTFGYRLTNTGAVLDKFAGYTVHYITGHTHVLYNVDRLTNSSPLFEHNHGAVCASWWWSGKLTPGIHVGVDGAPGGYGIWTIDGTTVKWQFKGTGKNINYQFRSYDLNNVAFPVSDFSNASQTTDVTTAYAPYVAAYPANSNNQVLINVWDWDPEWTVTVTENGSPLSVSHVVAYDPLHIAALSVKRLKSATTEVPGFLTETAPHFFKVTAANATDDLVITVKDEFGNTYTENMARPKAFSTDAYQNN